MVRIFYKLSEKKRKDGFFEVLISGYPSKKNRFQLRSGLTFDEKHFIFNADNEDSPLAVLITEKEEEELGKRKRDSLFNYLNDLKDKFDDYVRLVRKICDVTQPEHEEEITRNYVQNSIRIFNKYKMRLGDVTYELLKEKATIEAKEAEEQKQINRRQSFFELLDDYRDNSKKKVHGKRTGDKSDVWKKNFDVLVRALKRYEWFVKLSHNKSFTLDIDTISSDVLDDFESFLRNEYQLLEEYPEIFEKIPSSIDKRRSPKPQPRGNNAICALFNKLKAFCTWCIEERKTTNNPFIGFYGVSAEVYGTPYYITLEERNQIADFDLSDNPSLEAQRDIFIFQCCVGCRVSDLMRLEPKDIIDDVLQYIPQKTKGIKPITIYVPLNERAKSLVKKYSGKDKEGKLFPFISSQKYNEAIKKIFEVCGITRLVSVLNPLTGEEVKRPINEVASSHMARRCFVGNLYQKVQDPALIASMSGHSEHSRAFSRYRKIDDEMKKEVVNLID
jgi:integrase